jgi:hypothetical protein
LIFSSASLIPVIRINSAVSVAPIGRFPLIGRIQNPDQTSAPGGSPLAIRHAAIAGALFALEQYAATRSGSDLLVVVQ